MCFVSNSFSFLGGSSVGTGNSTYDGTSAITLEYTISLNETTTYKCNATKTDNGVTEATVNISKTGKFSVLLDVIR